MYNWLVNFLDIQWDSLTLFGKTRMVLFGPPTLIIWNIIPFVFLWAIVTWDFTWTGLGLVGILVGLIGLWLAGKMTFDEIWGIIGDDDD